jgi:hypothetical protein
MRTSAVGGRRHGGGAALSTGGGMKWLVMGIHRFTGAIDVSNLRKNGFGAALSELMFLRLAGP